MKKQLIIPALLLTLGIVFSSCGKEPVYTEPVDESYWLQKERGLVVYNDFGCDYYIVETNRGYAVVRNVGGLTPYVGDVLYGDFSSWGYKNVYNRASGYLIRADVRDYWLSWFKARDMVAYQCGR